MMSAGPKAPCVSGTITGIRASEGNTSACFGILFNKISQG